MGERADPRRPPGGGRPRGRASAARPPRSSAAASRQGAPAGPWRSRTWAISHRAEVLSARRPQPRRELPDAARRAGVRPAAPRVVRRGATTLRAPEPGGFPPGVNNHVPKGPAIPVEARSFTSTESRDAAPRGSISVRAAGSRSLRRNVVSCVRARPPTRQKGPDYGVAPDRSPRAAGSRPRPPHRREPGRRATATIGCSPFPSGTHPGRGWSVGRPCRELDPAVLADAVADVAPPHQPGGSSGEPASSIRSFGPGGLPSARRTRPTTVPTGRRWAPVPSEITRIIPTGAA